MKKTVDAFGSYHPVVNFLYFFVVLTLSMVCMHPVAVTISCVGAFCWSVYLRGKRAVVFSLVGILPMIMLMGAMNPLFNHRGSTILMYLPSGNPLTLESIFYGIMAAMMLASVMGWFSCYNQLMTSDKFIYLFGRVIPALSLLLSMALRFVPKLKMQVETIHYAQKCMGSVQEKEGMYRRIRRSIHTLSILITWALENAMETADSMKSRGYGLPGRTAFSIYTLAARDKDALLLIGSVTCYILAMYGAGGFYYRYYPIVRIAPLDAWSVSGLIAYLVLVFIPLAIDRKADNHWRQLEGGIGHGETH